MLLAVNATGGAQPGAPWAFYEYLEPEDSQYAYSGPRLPTGFYLMLSNTAAVSYKPENVIRGPLSMIDLAEADISAFGPLDWDLGVTAAPPRPTGKIPVTLHYGGRGIPRPLEDY